MTDRARRAVHDAIEGDEAEFTTAHDRAILRALNALATQTDLNRIAQDEALERGLATITKLRNAVTAAVTSIGISIVGAAIIAALSR